MNHQLTVITFLVLAMLVSLSSCFVVSHEEVKRYPDDWHEQSIENQDCNLVNGVYANTGKSSAITASYPITLDGAVFGRLPRRGEAEAVSLLYLADSLQILVMLDGELIDQTHPSSSFSLSAQCVDGWLDIDLSISGYVDGTYSNSQANISMTVSKNKSLIIHYKFDVQSKSLGVFKSSRAGSVWYLFPRVKSKKV